MRLIYFVDKITALDNERIHGLKCLTLNEEIFAQHFPHNPIYPAALMLQGGIDLSVYHHGYITEYKQSARLEAIQKVNYKGMAKPGNTIFYALHCSESTPDKADYHCQVITNEVVIMTAKWTISKQKQVTEIQARTCKQHVDLMREGILHEHHI